MRPIHSFWFFLLCVLSTAALACGSPAPGGGNDSDGGTRADSSRSGSPRSGGNTGGGNTGGDPDGTGGDNTGGDNTGGDNTGGDNTGGDSLCNDTCQYNGDGDCDDGGEGHDYYLCEYGSDCTDCGTRDGSDRPEGEPGGGYDWDGGWPDGDYGYY